MSWNFMIVLIAATVIVSAIVSGTIASKKGFSLNCKKLLVEGAITQAEFDAKKKELMG